MLPVHVLIVGAFGRSVAAHLRALHPDVVETAIDNAGVRPDGWPRSAALVVAAGRQVPRVCELADRISHESGRPFIPLITDASLLQLGPVVIPSRGCCWMCWSRRSLQHAEWPNETAALRRQYASDDRIGPRGFLEPFGMLAAARIAQTIDAIDAGHAPAGRLWQIDMLTRDVTTSTVVGIDHCPRCGLQRPPEGRTIGGLERELAFLWTGDQR